MTYEADWELKSVTHYYCCYCYYYYYYKQQCHKAYIYASEYCRRASTETT